MQVKQQIALPHTEFWREIAGLVKDGILFTKAKADGKEGYQPVPDGGSDGGGSGGGQVTVVHIDEDADGVEDSGDEAEDYPTSGRPPKRSPRASPRAGATAEKKKKKKKKKLTQAAEAAIEADGDDGGME